VKQIVEKVVRVFNPLLDDRHCSRGWGGIRVFKVTARYLESKQDLLERDSIAPFNIMKKADGRVVAFSNKSFAQTPI